MPTCCAQRGQGDVRPLRDNQPKVRVRPTSRTVRQSSIDAERCSGAPSRSVERCIERHGARPNGQSDGLDPVGQRHAGCEREIFNSDAIALIYEQSHGRLRDLDRLATDTLEFGARKKIKIIDRELVARVLGDGEPLDDD